MKKRRVNKTPLFIIIILICLIFGALYFFRGHFTKKEEEETKPEVLEKKEVEKTYNLSFTLAGNILINSGCRIIIIACNTASAMAVDYLRDKYKDIYYWVKKVKNIFVQESAGNIMGYLGSLEDI